MGGSPTTETPSGIGDGWTSGRQSILNSDSPSLVPLQGTQICHDKQVSLPIPQIRYSTSCLMAGFWRVFALVCA